MEPDTATQADDTAPGHTAEHEAGAVATAPALDLDGIERDLADVEVALARLDAGTYWTDEVTGQPLDEALLADHPTARRAAG
jgi:RNA polymerase-binding transcription factor DksA